MINKQLQHKNLFYCKAFFRYIKIAVRSCVRNIYEYWKSSGLDLYAKPLLSEMNNILNAIEKFLRMQNQNFILGIVVLMRQMLNEKNKRHCRFTIYEHHRHILRSDLQLRKKTYSFSFTYIFGTNTRNRARPRTFSKLWSA